MQADEGERIHNIGIKQLSIYHNEACLPGKAGFMTLGEWEWNIRQY